MSCSRAGEQFALLGAHEDRRLQTRVPWGGRSPRELTLGFRIGLDTGVILKAQAQKSMRDFAASGQFDLELTGNKGTPSLWEGAPSLIPMPWEV